MTSAFTPRASCAKVPTSTEAIPSTPMFGGFPQYGGGVAPSAPPRPIREAKPGDQSPPMQAPGGGGEYTGYFMAIKPSDTTLRVVDGTAPTGALAGPALINGTQFSVGAATITLQTTGTTYIWLTVTATGGTIGTPTITSGAALPSYAPGTCTVLLARVTAGVVTQEHYGMIYGIIWGSCES